MIPLRQRIKSPTNCLTRVQNLMNFSVYVSALINLIIVVVIIDTARGLVDKR